MHERSFAALMHMLQDDWGAEAFEDNSMGRTTSTDSARTHQHWASAASPAPQLSEEVVGFVSYAL